MAAALKNMTAIEHINAARETNLVDEDGDPIKIDLAPPLTPEQIDAVGQRVGVALPEELRTLLAFCSGINSCLEQIDFTGAQMAFEHNEVFPYGLPIASDGFGNFWVIDVTPQTTRTAPIFFACHDAPVILYQSPDIASFLSEVFRMSTPPHKSLVDDVHEDRLFNVWRKNPGVIDRATALQSSDAAIRAFASELPEHFQLVDLRNVRPGMGFSWGRYGPKTEVRRHGYERIFAYGIFAYGKPPRRGFLGSLFGR
jgi:hypothetical protein